MMAEEALSPREFLHRYHLPQLVRIHEAHLHQLNASRVAGSRNRSSIDSGGDLSPSSSSTSSGVTTNSIEEGLQLKEEKINSPTESNLLDLDQPFLLYKAYSCRQVIAYILDPNGLPDISSFKREGPALLIPENYSGWFAIVTGKGHTAGYFSTIDEIARAQVPYFLTRDDITGYLVPRVSPSPSAINPIQQPTAFTSSQQQSNSLSSSSTSSSSRNNCCYDKITITGGSVLRYVGLYEDISAFVLGNNKHKHSVRSKRGSLHVQEPGARYAKCISFSRYTEGEIVFIPINEVGRFYVVAKRTNGISYNHVYSISNILRYMKLPATVQLVVGPKPRNLNQSSSNSICNKSFFMEKGASDKMTFSAVLRLEEIRKRDCILSCTIRPQPFHCPAPDRTTSSLSSSIRRTLRGRQSNKNEDNPLLLEFDMDSSFTFIRTFVEKNGTLSSRKIPELVLQRISYCNKEANIWRKQIKVAHDITPKNSHPLLNNIAKHRKSIFDQDFQKSFNKTASIGSRASSNASNVSKLSKMLQRFWNPLKKAKFKDDDDIGFSGLIHLSDHEEEEEDCDNVVTKSKSSYHNTVTASDYHFYETLKQNEGSKNNPPKQKLARKQTLDVIFPDIQVDDDSYIISKKQLTDSFDDYVYSSVKR